MGAGSLIIREITYSGLEENISVRRIIYLHRFNCSTFDRNKPVKIVIAESFLWSIVPIA